MTDRRYAKRAAWKVTATTGRRTHTKNVIAGTLVEAVEAAGFTNWRILEATNHGVIR